jgi:tetratricopeptide (TPR) repeat protein
LLGQDAAALVDLERAEPLMQGIVAGEPNNRIWQGNLYGLRLDRLRILLNEKGAAAVLPFVLALERESRTLTALDSKARDWMLLSALTKHTIAAALAQLGRTAEARNWNEQSIEGFKRVYAVTHADQYSPLYLARALITQADLQLRARDREGALRTCGEAADLTRANATEENNYRKLDLWARSQLCLGKRAAAEMAMARLDRVGYREATYLNYINNTNLKEK